MANGNGSPALRSNAINFTTHGNCRNRDNYPLFPDWDSWWYGDISTVIVCHAPELRPAALPSGYVYIEIASAEIAEIVSGSIIWFDISRRLNWLDEALCNQTVEVAP